MDPRIILKTRYYTLIKIFFQLKNGQVHQMLKSNNKVAIHGVQANWLSARFGPLALYRAA